MPFDWNRHLRGLAEWLVMLSETPGWTEQAKARRDEKLADPLYAGLKEQIQAVRRERSASLSPESRLPKEGPAPAADRAGTSASTPPKKP